MRWNRLWFLVVTLLVSSLLGGMVTQQAQAQAYRVDIDFALQRSFLLGQDIIILGTLTVLGPRSGDDVVTVTVLSPDSAISAQAFDIDVPVSASLGQEFGFAVQQLTFVGGEFTVIATSVREGTLLQPMTYGVSNLDVQVRTSALSGEVGTQFVITTTIDVGNMSEVQSRFDVEYVLDGARLRQSSFVVLFGDVIAFIQDSMISPVTLVQDEAARSWETTQGFTLTPGAHTLAVRVVDRSISQTLFTTSFSIQVTDQVRTLETRVDELALEVGGQVDDLADQTSSAALTASSAALLAGSLMALALAALALSVVTLLMQFGILRFGRFKRGPEQPGEPEE